MLIAQPAPSTRDGRAKASTDACTWRGTSASKRARARWKSASLTRSLWLGNGTRTRLASGIWYWRWYSRPIASLSASPSITTTANSAAVMPLRGHCGGVNGTAAAGRTSAARSASSPAAITTLVPVAWLPSAAAARAAVVTAAAAASGASLPPPPHAVSQAAAWSAIAMTARRRQVRSLGAACMPVFSTASGCALRRRQSAHRPNRQGFAALLSRSRSPRQ